MAAHRTVWLNGSFIPEDEAVISPYDLGLTAGDGCYETLVSYWKTPFAFTRHYNRLTASAEALGITGVPPRDQLLKAAQALLRDNNCADPACIRITVTAGVARPGSVRGSGPCTVLIGVSQPPDYGESVKLSTVPFIRNDLSPVAGIRTTSRVENVIALLEARKSGAGEAVLANTKGNTCEGTESNIFWVRDGVVQTPPLSSGALDGITRGLVMALCGQLGIPVEESDLPLAQLPAQKEIFLTSTMREIQPVTALDDHRLIPGATTIRLRKAYRDMIEDDLDP